MTIDLSEIYIGVLKRGCQIRLIAQKEVYGVVLYYIEITEGSGVRFTVTLSSDHRTLEELNA